MKILDIPQPGKKGLDVSMNGRYGQASRTLVIPTNPRAASQMTIRANLSAVAKLLADPDGEPAAGLEQHRQHLQFHRPARPERAIDRPLRV